ncbi:MAG: class sortase [Friedmanniella sp.]|nr:class sortase [Friedmanniella sp.]
MLLLLGLTGLGWLGYQYLGTNLMAERAFASERAGLRARWAGADPTASPRTGEATALLRVPGFGSGYEVPILEGTTPAILARGVGHYPGTAQAGQLGNFALAGHRITHGEPFARLLDLRRGDEVVVETRTAVYTYVLDQPPGGLTVRDTAGWVLDPVPGRPTAAPGQALITLTTAQDLLATDDRAVGFGHLVSTRNR